MKGGAMQDQSFRHGLMLSMVVITFLLTACGSAPVMVGKLPPLKYQKLGPATGEACGTLGLLTPPANFLPMALNSRVEDAYRQAIHSMPGATGLINVEYKEDWFWWVLATTRCTTITGDAIMEAL
jgi:hypothetical protein